MDDLRAVMDAAGSQRAAIYGGSEGGALAILFAATYPERVSALVLYGAYPRMAWAPDYPDGIPDEMWDEGLRVPRGELGPRSRRRIICSTSSRRTGPTIPPGAKHTGDGSACRQVREPLSRFMQMIREIDVRHLCRRSGCRHSLCIGRRTSRTPRAAAIWARTSPAPKSSNLPGNEYFPYLGDQDAILDEIEEFLTGVRPVHVPDRALATVLFTDIVSSTQRAAALGDDAWTRNWTNTTPWSLARSSAIVAERSSRRVTAWPQATVRRPRERGVRCARAGSARPCPPLGIEVRRDFTPARSNFAKRQTRWDRGPHRSTAYRGLAARPVRSRRQIAGTRTLRCTPSRYHVRTDRGFHDSRACLTSGEYSPSMTMSMRSTSVSSPAVAPSSSIWPPWPAAITRAARLSTAPK